MPIVLARSSTFKWKFKLREIAESGEVVESAMTLIVRRVDEPEFQELIKESQAELLKKVIVGWPSGEVLGSDGPIEYSPENFDALIADPHRVRQLSQEYVRANVTLPEKN
ncbi:hypothetical protein [Paraburkholderia aromaticivorans]|uniref:hypothetical protein n=1 Tax=Paraburkholderia aromaticivorans TaxID=2026199 RepID=UPI0014560BC5|nr:hypothetical protein [Paraburkholderia aromaticivorans]